MKQTRREAMGTIGGILGGIAFGRALPNKEASAVYLPESELEVPTELNEITAGEPTAPESTATEAIESAPSVEVVKEEPLEPRISPLLEVQIRDKMLELLETNGFNAGSVLIRAAHAEHEGAPLMDTVHDTFRETIFSERQFRQIDSRAINWFVDVCVRGQVTAESEWNVTSENSRSSAKGLWQILDIARRQIDIERGDGRQMVNRHNPEDATRGAAEFYDYILRSLDDRAADIKALFDVNDTEFTLPLLMTAYHSGVGPMHAGIRSYIESEPDTNLVGLDVFADFTHHLRESDIEGLPAHSPDYFMKCLALKRIYEEIPNLMK